MDTATTRARLADNGAQVCFVLAGRAVFTVLNTRTGVRFTYRVTRCKNRGKALWFVSVLTGPDNGGDYQYLGTVFGPAAPSVESAPVDWIASRYPLEYQHGRRSKVGVEAKSALGFAWLWRVLCADTLPDYVQVWHEGRCGRCGRPLTDPESIARGLGPVCGGAQ